MNRTAVHRVVKSAALFGLLGSAIPASATTIYTDSNLTDTAAEPHFVALVDADLHRPPLVTFTWGSSLPKGSRQGSFELPPTDDFTSYAVFGLDDAGGIFVTLPDGAADAGQPFATLFPGFVETDLAKVLASGTDTQLVDDFATLISTTQSMITPMGTRADVLHFSDGADYGTFEASFTPVPEPTGGAIALAASMSGLLVRRRRCHTTHVEWRASC